MSMCYWMKQTSDACIELLARRSDLSSAFVLGEEPTPKIRQKSRGILSSLFGRQPDEPPTAPDLPADYEAEGATLDLDKSWHGLHYLFTGTDWESPLPEGFLLNAGVTLEGTDYGYGEARGCSSSEVRVFSECLSSLTDQVLSARYNPSQMSELSIYPQHWEREGELDYLIDAFHELQQFMRGTAEKSLGLVCLIS